LAWASDAVTLTQDQVLAVQDAVLAWAAGAVAVSSGGSGATVEEIWNYEIAPGVTAAQMLIAIKAKTDNLPASPAAVGSQMTLAAGAITALVNAIVRAANGADGYAIEKDPANNQIVLTIPGVGTVNIPATFSSTSVGVDAVG
jgi:hypothetical protein